MSCLKFCTDSWLIWSNFCQNLKFLKKCQKSSKKCKKSANYVKIKKILKKILKNHKNASKMTKKQQKMQKKNSGRHRNQISAGVPLGRIDRPSMSTSDLNSREKLISNFGYSTTSFQFFAFFAVFL